jgi:hypothetical protein
VVHGQANIPDSLIEHALQISLGEGRAFQVLVGANLLGHDQGLIIRYGLHSLGSQALQGSWVFSQIKLGADEDDGDRGRMVIDLREPLDTHSVRDGLGDFKRVCVPWL